MSEHGYVEHQVHEVAGFKVVDATSTGLRPHDDLIWLGVGAGVDGRWIRPESAMALVAAIAATAHGNMERRRISEVKTNNGQQIGHVEQVTVNKEAADAEPLIRCELLTILYLSQLSENLAFRVAEHEIGASRRAMASVEIAHLSDRAEHVAQYALGELSGNERAKCLEGDVEAITSTLREFKEELCNSRAVPSVKDVQLLHSSIRSILNTKPAHWQNPKSAPC